MKIQAKSLKLLSKKNGYSKVFEYIADRKRQSRKTDIYTMKRHFEEIYSISIDIRAFFNDLADLGIGQREQRYFFWHVKSPNLVGEMALGRVGGKHIETTKAIEAPSVKSLKDLSDSKQLLADFVLNQCSLDIRELCDFFNLAAEKIEYRVEELIDLPEIVKGKSYFSRIILPKNIKDRKKVMILLKAIVDD